MLLMGLTLLFGPVYGQTESPSGAGVLGRGEMFLHGGTLPGVGDALASPAAAAFGDDEASRALWLEAESLYGQGFFGRAARVFGDYLRMSPSGPSAPLAMLRISECRMAEGNYGDALSCLEACEPSVRRTLLEGICLLHLGRTTAAESALSSISGDNSDARYYLGYIAFSRGDYGLARTCFAGLPAGTDAECYAVALDYLDGSWSKASSGARRLLERPGTPAIWRGELQRIAGESLFAQGKKTEGMGYIDQYLATTARPLPGALLLAGASDYSSGDYEGAITDLERAATDPGAIGQAANLLLGQSFFRLGRSEASVLAFERASRNGASGADPLVRETAWFNYVASKFAGAQLPFDSASGAFEEFLAEYPSGPYSDHVREYLAEGYAAESDYARALERLEAIRRPGPRALAAKQYILYVMGSAALSGGNDAEAGRLLERARSVGANEPAVAAEIVLQRARLAAREGNHAEGARLYGEYLRTAPRNADNRPVALYGQGYALFNGRDYAQADAAFGRAAASGAFSGGALADIYIRRGDIASYGGNFAQALDYYLLGARTDARTADWALLQGARMQGYLRNYNDKLATLGTLEREHPQSALMPDVLLERTEALISLGRKGEAIDTYSTLIERYPLTSQGRQGYLQMALTLLDMNRQAEAEEAYREVISHYPTSDEARQATTLLRRLYAEAGRGDEFLAFMASVEGAPETSREDAAELAYGSAHRRYTATGDTLGLSRFLADYPDSPQAEGALEHLGDAAFAAGDIPGAMTHYRALEARASTPPRRLAARMGLMRTLRESGDYAGAGEMARMVLAQPEVGDAAFGEATYTLGNSLADDDRLDEALEVWATMASRTAEAYGAASAFARAEGLFTQGKQEEALAAAQALSGSHSPHQYWVARAFILQSDIYAATGRPYEAREYLRALEANYPGNETDIRDMIQSRLQSMAE